MQNCMNLRNQAINSLARLTRPRMLESLDELKRLEHAKEGQVYELQLEKFNTLLNHYRNDSVYNEYRNQNNKVITSFEEMKSLPIVTKSFLRSHFDNTVNQAIGYRKSSTSGSSGVNLDFFQCKRMLDSSSAAYRHCTCLTGVDPWGDQQIGVWGKSPLTSYTMKLEIRAKQFLTNDLQLNAYGMDEEISTNYLKILKRKKPKLLYGYPSYIHLLAVTGLKYCIEPPNLEAIITSGEQLQKQQRDDIELYFGNIVFNRYGSREFGVIGHESKLNKAMYVPPTRYILETDPCGHLLVTDLDNFATPFIRYDIGDLATLGSAKEYLGYAGQCIVKISGRTNDSLVTSSGKHITGQFLTLLTRQVPGILDFQYVLIGSNNLTMFIVVSDAYNNAIEFGMVEYFNRYFGDEMSLKIEHRITLERTDAGKRKFIIKKEAAHSV